MNLHEGFKIKNALDQISKTAKEAATSGAVESGPIIGFQPPGDNYKRTSPIYDAFGNFAYGATGAAAGFEYSTLQTVAELLHRNHNDPINHQDIKSGFDAIEGGGTLSVKNDTLTP